MLLPKQFNFKSHVMAPTTAQNAINNNNKGHLFVNFAAIHAKTCFVFQYKILNMGSDHPNKTGKQHTTLNQEKHKPDFFPYL